MQQKANLMKTPNLTNKEFFEKLEKCPRTKKQFYNKPESQQDIFREICTNQRPFPITYDAYFKYIFDVDKHPGRLAEFLSAIMECKVTVKKVLPHEQHVVNELGHMVIMDIVVQLEDGSIVNVEIQKNPYDFLGERASCYSSDLVMREYQKLNESKKNEETNQKFNYKDMRPVYTIVLLERSTSTFHALPEHFIHKGECVFDTGLKLNMLQHYIYIPLDIFIQKTHNKSNIDNKLEAWLTLLSETDEARINALFQAYPNFADIYLEIDQLRHNIEEAFSMFSEDLAVLDRNTQEYMVDEMQKKIEVLQNNNEDLQKDKEDLIRINYQLKNKQYKNLVEELRECNVSDEMIFTKLINKYSLPKEEAEKYLR